MGVPVITKKGNHFLSHLGESIAHNSGLSDWIASDEEEYVAKAVAYASNLEALSELRNGMREQILGTPLLMARRKRRIPSMSLLTPGGRDLENVRPSGGVPEWPKGSDCKSDARASVVRIHPPPPRITPAGGLEPPAVVWVPRWGVSVLPRV